MRSGREASSLILVVSFLFLALLINAFILCPVKSILKDKMIGFSQHGLLEVLGGDRSVICLIVRIGE